MSAIGDGAKVVSALAGQLSALIPAAAAMERVGSLEDYQAKLEAGIKKLESDATAARTQLATIKKNANEEAAKQAQALAGDREALTKERNAFEKDCAAKEDEITERLNKAKSDATSIVANAKRDAKRDATQIADEILSAVRTEAAGITDGVAAQKAELAELTVQVEKHQAVLRDITETLKQYASKK